MKFIFSCLLSLSFCFFGYLHTFAQSAPPDTVRTDGIRIGLDVGKVGYYFLTNNTNRTVEVTADMAYKKILLVAEAGYSMLDINKENYSYSSNGFFGRIGIEHNILKNGGNNYIFIGARYGLGQFTYQVSDIMVQDEFWGDYPVLSSSQSVMAHWGEAVGGVKVNFFGNVFLGFTARFKLRVAESEYGEVAPILIPGFGKPDKRNAMGFNYYIYYLIPFKK